MSQRVLLIDDSPLQLRARKAVLRDAGFDVCIATTADNALALLRSGLVGNSIGVVVTDHVMPGVSGVEFVKAIRRIHPHMPVIVITGLPAAESEYEGLNIEFRQKPCHPSELIELVRRSMSEAA